MGDATESAESRPPRPGERLALVGGVLLLIAVLAPVDWFREVSSGGISGRGSGEPPRDLSAWDAFGPWLLPVVVAAVTPAIDLLLGRSGRMLPIRVRLAVIVAGLIVLTAGVILRLNRDAGHPDEIYMHADVKGGLVLAAIGALMLAIGAMRSRGTGG